MHTVSGYVRIRNFTMSSDGNTISAGKSATLDDFLQSIYAFLEVNYPKFYKMDRLSKAGLLAAEVLLKSHSIAHHKPSEVAVVLANKNASLDTDLRYAEASRVVSSPAIFVYTLPNIVLGEICIRHGIKGENAFFVSEKFDAGLLCDYTEQVLSQPSVNACVSGWVEVMDEHHDVLVYLTEKQGGGLALPHTAEQLNIFYQ